MSFTPPPPLVIAQIFLQVFGCSEIKNLIIFLALFLFDVGENCRFSTVVYASIHYKERLNNFTGKIGETFFLSRPLVLSSLVEI